MKEKIIGRTAEFQRLDECMEQDTAQLIIVYGRRRVGKTFLINEYFDNDFTFKITGAYNQPAKYQLQNFVMELNRSFRTEYSVPKDWVSAFDMLRTCLEEQATERKKVVFFDEMPWLDTRGSGFLSAFEWFWNNWACARSDIVFIVCGSASSWMVEKLADNKGGLFNRQTCRLYLKPFNLNEVEDFLQKKGIYWSHYEIAECYMIMGGIPYYLSLLSNRYSYSQNIDNLFFRDKGELWDEFDHLYKTLFSNSASYIKLVELLSKKTGGLTLKEIGAVMGVSESRISQIHGKGLSMLRTILRAKLNAV